MWYNNNTHGIEFLKYLCRKFNLSQVHIDSFSQNLGLRHYSEQCVSGKEFWLI